MSSIQRSKLLNYNQEIFREKLELYIYQIKKLDKDLKTTKAKKWFLRLSFLIFHYSSYNDLIDYEKLNLLNEELVVYNSKEIKENEEKFIKKLISEDLIKDKEEYTLFKNLYDFFQKKQKNSEEIKNLLEFWAKKTK